jgi:hypothetical protein
MCEVIWSAIEVPAVKERAARVLPDNVVRKSMCQLSKQEQKGQLRDVMRADHGAQRVLRRLQVFVQPTESGGWWSRARGGAVRVYAEAGPNEEFIACHEARCCVRSQGIRRWWSDRREKGMQHDVTVMTLSHLKHVQKLFSTCIHLALRVLIEE